MIPSLSLCASVGIILTALKLTSVLTEESFCDPYICQCLYLDAICTTYNKDEVIPQNLDPETGSLDVTFKSLDSFKARLRQINFRRYESVKMLYLAGDFESIDGDAFHMLTNLTDFRLAETSISYLPDNLFLLNTELLSVALMTNKFERIPMNAFRNSTNIKINAFSFADQLNLLVPCNNNTLVLPHEFYKFTHLNYFRFTEIRLQSTNCSAKISEDFFKPVSTITELMISGYDYIDTNVKALKKLTLLKNLVLGLLRPYQTCPSKAKTLFDSIPRTVEKFFITNWDTTQHLTDECLFTKETLQPLSSLKLTQLGFTGSDGIFGSTLTQNVIPKMSTIEVLDLASCRFSIIEEGALEGYPQLSRLYLNGNPLGPKELNMLRQPALNMKSLSLNSANLRSNYHFYYNATTIFRDFPNLESLDLSMNKLERLPTVVSSKKYMQFQELIASSNLIQHFTDPFGDGSDNFCLIFPNLQAVNLNSNRLRSVQGLELCRNMKQLLLSQNQFQYDYMHNESGLANVLQNLTRMRNLELSGNRFRTITVGLISHMANLESFAFGNNNLEALNSSTFKGNLKLQYIDLSFNSIQFIYHDVFSSLSSLKVLDLQGNLIASFNSNFLSSIDNLVELTSLRNLNNPYDCGCGGKHFQDWLKNQNQLIGSDQKYITCSSPPKVKGSLVHDYQYDFFECVVKINIIISASIVGSFLITLIIMLLCFKYRWHVRHFKMVYKAFVRSLEIVKMEKVCAYDAYVSFDPNCQEDSVWIAEELIPAIETPVHSDDSDVMNESSSTLAHKRSLKLYLEQRDALGGTNRFTEREIALSKSKKILIVVSNSYLRSVECLSEADLSGLLMHGTEFYQPNRVMLIIREELNEDIIRPPMSSLLLGKTVKVETNERKRNQMWREVRKFLSVPLYIYTKPTKPADSSNFTDSGSLNASNDVNETSPLISVT